jgi:hypothetical protein
MQIKNTPYSVKDDERNSRKTTKSANDDHIAQIVGISLAAMFLAMLVLNAIFL